MSEIAEIVEETNLAVLLHAANHVDGVFVGSQRINDLKEYTLAGLPHLDSDDDPRDIVNAIWNIGFTAGVAYSVGVTPDEAEAEQITNADVQDTFAELGIRVEFADDGDDEAPF